MADVGPARSREAGVPLGSSPDGSLLSPEPNSQGYIVMV